MRLTVGPMPASVYWRRRAVVAGVVLVVVLILAYSCGGGDDPASEKSADPKASSTALPGEGVTTPAPSLISPSSNEPSVGNPPNAAGNTGATAPDGASGETCTDGELSVVSAADNASVRQGFPVKFYIRIKNISSRTCVRDVGAQVQELYLEQNGTKQWSSDACGDTNGAADVRSFPPSHEREYFQVWEGRSTVQGCTGQPLAKAGTYQLRARLGNKVSDPLTVTITA